MLASGRAGWHIVLCFALLLPHQTPLLQIQAMRAGLRARCDPSTALPCRCCASMMPKLSRWARLPSTWPWTCCTQTTSGDTGCILFRSMPSCRQASTWFAASPAQPLGSLSAVMPTYVAGIVACVLLHPWLCLAQACCWQDASQSCSGWSACCRPSSPCYILTA